MTNKEKQESLRASFGPTPDIFRESVKHTLAHIEEEQPVKRFTLRTVALAIVLIILMAGIALAISTSNGIFSFLEKSTPLPTEAKEALQTEFTQEGGDLPHVTFRVRDAISDGKTLFIAVECKTKNPDDVVVTMMDYVPNSDEKVLADWNAMMSNREGRPDLGSITPDQNVHYVYYSFATKLLQGADPTDGNIMLGTDFYQEDLSTIVYNLMIDLSGLENPQEELTLELSNSELTNTFFEGYDLTKTDPEKPIVDFEPTAEATLTATIRAGDMPRRISEAETPFTFGDITFESLTVETSPLATYFTLKRNETTPENPGTMRFEMYHEDGTPYDELATIYQNYMGSLDVPLEMIHTGHLDHPKAIVLHAIPFIESQDAPMPDDLTVPLHEITP